MAAIGAASIAGWGWAPLQARVLDDFNDNQKTGWTDFTFVPGVGLPLEQNGQFSFALPGAVLQQVKSGLFSASTKSTETFTLKEGRTVEFRVDVVQGGGKDSFAVLSFIPASSGGPSKLQGYSIAKSTTDVLLVKGINQYFVADDGPTAELKQENITLVLTLTVEGGNVIMEGKVLDKDANNAVIWQRRVVDTPAADVLADGTENPTAPYLGDGNFVLYLYADYAANALEDPYQAVFDNAEYYVLDREVLDDFNGSQKAGWTDFTFVPGAGLPVQANGQFTFALPGAVLQQVKSGLFSASTKTSRNFSLVEGERVEFQVDVVSGGLKDSFAVLAFTPLSVGGPSKLQGYSLAKSTTDVLLVKGINQYFVADAGPSANLKQENITLVLSLTVKGGNVIFHGKVLDKDANNAVIWERSVVDTPAADVLASGTENPTAPYLGDGNFVLYLYADYAANALEDPYIVVYDNAVAAAPPAAGNTPPIISEVQPEEFANFLPAPAQISFRVTDDKALVDSKISVTLNGTNYTTANGLTLSGTGTARTATLGGIGVNLNCAALLKAEDSEGLLATKELYFDTFSSASLVIEAEDYNYGGGQFIDNPVPVAEGGFQLNSYSLMAGLAGIDFSDTRTAPNFADTRYRPEDPVRMGTTRDRLRSKYTALGGPDAEVYDYDVGDIAANEWMNYTRTVPAGTYAVYLREAIYNMSTADSLLELVTSDPSQPDQTTRQLGSFLGRTTGFLYRNFPLTDGTGQNLVPLRLSGKTNLRLRQVTANADSGARLLNYLVFIPMADTGPQRAAVSDVNPAPNSLTQTAAPIIRATIENRDTSVNVSTVALALNGQTVPATVKASTTGATLEYSMIPLPASGATNQARLSFKDSEGVDVSTEWQFVISYLALDPANRALGKGMSPGFLLRMVQAPGGSALANSLERAEEQLAPNSTIPVLLSTNTTVPVVNLNQNEFAADGVFGEDILVPGLAETYETDDFSVELQAWLDLAAGTYRFGVITDDGYKISSGKTLADKEPVLSFRNGGTANQSFDFVVTASGLYPFRMVWYERGGSAHAELSSINVTTGERLLINDATKANAIKAYTSIAEAPKFNPVTLSAGQLRLSWTGAGTLEEADVVRGPWRSAPSQANPQNVSVTGAVQKFYRLRQ
jgi:hypothetical protein